MYYEYAHRIGQEAPKAGKQSVKCVLFTPHPGEGKTFAIECNSPLDLFALIAQVAKKVKDESFVPEMNNRQMIVRNGKTYIF